MTVDEHVQVERAEPRRHGEEPRAVVGDQVRRDPVHRPHPVGQRRPHVLQVPGPVTVVGHRAHRNHLVKALEQLPQRRQRVERLFDPLDEHVVLDDDEIPAPAAEQPPVTVVGPVPARDEPLTRPEPDLVDTPLRLPAQQLPRRADRCRVSVHDDLESLPSPVR